MSKSFMYREGSRRSSSSSTSSSGKYIERFEFEKSIETEMPLAPSSKRPGSVPLMNVPYRSQCNREMYSIRALEKRSQLRRNKDICHSLNRFWRMVVEREGFESVSQSRYMMVSWCVLVET